MRALSSERMVVAAPRRKDKPREAASARRRPVPRRKPPPRWRRPALAGAVAATLALLGAAAAIWLWHADYPRLALAWAGQVAGRAQIAAGLKVEEVILWGRDHMPKEELSKALGIRRGEPILGVDLGAARGRLEAMGWIESARVARRLPDLLEVRILERTPLALWQRQGKLVLIGRGGAVITAKGLERFRELPIVVGKDASAHAWELLEVLGREPQLFRRIEAAVRVGGRRWNLRLQNGIEVRLPEGGEAEAWSRLAMLEKRHKILARQLVAIDMRLPDRLVVRLAPGSAARFRDPGEKT